MGRFLNFPLFAYSPHKSVYLFFSSLFLFFISKIITLQQQIDISNLLKRDILPLRFSTLLFPTLRVYLPSLPLSAASGVKLSSKNFLCRSAEVSFSCLLHAHFVLFNSFSSVDFDDRLMSWSQISLQL